MSGNQDPARTSTPSAETQHQLYRRIKGLGQATKILLDPSPLGLMDPAPTMQVGQGPQLDDLAHSSPLCPQGSWTQCAILKGYIP